MSYLAHDGTWAPDDHSPAIPVSDIDDGFRSDVWFPNAYVNHELWEQSYSQAGVPSSIWENIKFAGAVWGRILATDFLPVAEWDVVGRGEEMPLMQSPNVVSGNVYELQRLERRGPFNDPRQSQAAIEAYLAAAVPQDVQTIEDQNQWGGTIAFPGYGRPGG